MMTRRQGLLALEDWLTRVEADDQPELHRQRRQGGYFGRPGQS